MKTLYESLLDDLDELENDATKNVYKQNTIGKKYKIDKVYCGGDFSKLKTHFDIKKLKQLHSKYAVWESDNFDVKKRKDGSIATKNKSIINIVKLFADIVLSVDESNLTVGKRAPGFSDELVNILSQAYVAYVSKSELKVWSRSESQTSELYGIIVYNDDISLVFVIEPKQK